jgi:glycosyltransferase involved in cell wall biosynthesis
MILSIIIPTYNEEHKVIEILKKLLINETNKSCFVAKLCKNT